MQRDPKYKTIVHFIEDRIRSGELKTGDRLPSVNALRIRFSLSRSSIFLAMEELKSRGIVEAEPAVGYYVRSTNIEVQEKVESYVVLAPFTNWVNKKKYAKGDKISISESEWKGFENAFNQGKLKKRS